MINGKNIENFKALQKLFELSLWIQFWRAFCFCGGEHKQKAFKKLFAPGNWNCFINKWKEIERNSDKWKMREAKYRVRKTKHRKQRVKNNNHNKN